MIVSKKLSLTIVLFLLVAGVLISYQVMENIAYSDQEKEEEIANIDFDMLDDDPIMQFLGKGFDEIKQVLGEPDDQGYSDFLGPHEYILYQEEKGSVRFCAPELTEYKIVISIILGPGQEINGARVGMPFTEIEDILGEPAFGPEPGMDDLYYMGYFFGEMNQQVPQVFISFSAASVDGPTQDVFIKWEAFEYAQSEIIQGEI